MVEWIGLCRRKGEDGGPNTVVYTDKTRDTPEDVMTEQEYRQLAAKPPYDDLPYCGQVPD